MELEAYTFGQSCAERDPAYGMKTEHESVCGRGQRGEVVKGALPLGEGRRHPRGILSDACLCPSRCLRKQASG